MKKKYYLYLCVGISTLLLVLKWNDINSFLANQSITWADKMIDRQKTVMFRSGRVDSLYVNKKYSYYLFTKEGVNSEAIQKLPYDSVLTIKPIGLSQTPVKVHLDTISLPVSVLDLMVKKDESLALYQILSAQKDSIGYLYRLRRIPIEEIK